MWEEWWNRIQSLPDDRRNRALTNRCKECGKGRLHGVTITLVENDVENICNECK